MTQEKNKLSLSHLTKGVKSNESGSVKSYDAKKEISRYGIGFDVHKRKIAVCVAAQLTSGNIITIKEHTFNANPNGIKEICSFVQKYSPISNYLMECTGVYHLPLYHSLKASVPTNSSKVIAMNPLIVNRRITELGNKTDKADAQSMAYLTFYSSLLRPSYVGSMEFFHLRDTMRRYHQSIKQCTRLKNRITRLLHSSNIKDVFDLGREWALVLLDRYISKDWTLSESYERLINEYKDRGAGTRILEKQYGNIVPYEDIKLSKDVRFAIRMELAQLIQEQVIAVTFLRRAESQTIEIPALLEGYQKLLLIPGMGAVGALTIMLELGDYTRFKDASAFAKFCGTAPLIYNSGEHISRGRLNRFSNKFIRTALINTAGPIINRKRKDCDIAEYAYKQYHVRHLPYKKALIKVANKIAKMVYHILVDDVEFDPNYDQKQKKQKDLRRRLERKQTLLSTTNTRALRRDIEQFLAANFEYLNSSSRFLLCSGMHQMLKRANFINGDKEGNMKGKK